MMRLFVAINLPGDVRAALFDCAAPLRAEFASRVAWTPAEKLHVTVQFIGPRPREDAVAIETALRQALAGASVTRIDVAGAGVFPSAARPRVLWFGVAPNSALDALYHLVAGATSVLGVEAEARPFHPHVTLGRVRSGRSIDGARFVAMAARAECVASVAVRSIDLMESASGPAGARYVLQAAVPLTARSEER
jgi:2'-5' RNA ligase